MSLEPLEDRTLLNSAPVLDIDTDSYSITAGQPWYIPLRSTDADGDAVYYIVESQSDDLNASLSYGTAYNAENLPSVDSRNPYWKLIVEQAASTTSEGFSGTMLFELFADTAPITVSMIEDYTNWTVLSNTQTQEEYKFYNNALFHRIIDNFMAQCGCLNSVDGSELYYYQQFASGIEDEFNENLRFTSVGVLGMANTGERDSGSCQFFITDAQCQHLDFLHSVFGFLNDGLETLDKITGVETSGSKGITREFFVQKQSDQTDASGNIQYEWGKETISYQDMPLTDVILKKAEIVTNYTGSTLTISAGTASTANGNYSTTLTVTPVDALGNHGDPRTIYVHVSPDTNNNNYPPILSDSEAYAVMYSGIESTYQLKYLDLNGDKAGFAGILYTIEVDENGNGRYVKVESGYSVDYQTGVVTFDGSLAPGNYYLQTFIEVYSESSDILNNYTDHRWIALLVAPPAPSGISLNEESDTGTLGDGVTSLKEGLSFTIDGCQEGYTVALFVKGTDSNQLLGYTTCATNETSVTITPSAAFPNGFYELYAIQVVDAQQFYYSSYGWYSVEVDSQASPTFQLTIPYLAAPANVSVSEIKAQSLKVAWDAVANAQGYRVYWKKTTDSSWYYDEATASSYVVSGLEPGMEYDIAVQAVDVNVASDYSRLESTVNTLHQLPAPKDVTAMSEAIVNQETQKSSLQITVSWTSDAGVTSYAVYYKPLEAGEWECSVVTADPEPGKLESRIVDLDLDKIYEYQVIAVPDEQTQTDYEQSVGVSDWAYAPELSKSFAFLDYTVQEMADWTYESAVANKKREAVTSVNEWQSLLLELWSGWDESEKTYKTYNTGQTLRFVLQYDTRYWVADVSHVALIEGVTCKTQQQVADDNSLAQLEILLSITDSTKVGSDGLMAYVPLYASDQSSGNVANCGVSAKDIKVESELLPYRANDSGDLEADKSKALTVSVWAVPYDLNDSGTVDMSDFIQFAKVFNQTPIEGESSIANAANFDGQGSVSMADFILFAQHFNQSWSQNPTVNIPLKSSTETSAKTNASSAALAMAPEPVLIAETATPVQTIEIATVKTTVETTPESTSGSTSVFSVQSELAESIEPLSAEPLAAIEKPNAAPRDLPVQTVWEPVLQTQLSDEALLDLLENQDRATESFALLAASIDNKGSQLSNDVIFNSDNRPIKEDLGGKLKNSVDAELEKADDVFVW